MKRALPIVRMVFVGSALLAGAGLHASHTAPTGAVPVADSAWQADLLAWRANRARHLAGPNGWLTLVGLDWLKPGANRLTAPAPQGPAALIGTLVLKSGKVTLEAPPGGFPAELREDGSSPHAGDLSFDEEHPTQLTIGTRLMTVIKRGERYAVRTKDSKAPTRTSFHGLQWYAPDPRYTITAQWTPYVPPHTLRIPTVLGTTDEMPSPGVAQFTIDGKKVRLEPVLEEPGAKELFFILRDTTGRTTTDGAARFLYTSFPDHGLGQPGKLVIDFNRLYNPPCAFTPYATCPLPPAQNRLAVALPVGEKRYTPLGTVR
ncbi:MAG TPA: DUF1684 domain-containing protein [Acidobacteriaceae bacterium]